MNWFIRLIRYFFLVKEIVAKNGDVHFRRYRLIQLPWFSWYIHQICKSDLDRDPHTHPWNFMSIILSGAYQEMAWYPPLFKGVVIKDYYAGDVIEHRAEDAHKLTLISKQVWTMVFTWGRPRVWGYQIQNVCWINHEQYRLLKNEGKL